jgi:hypothetical protein
MSIMLGMSFHTINPISTMPTIIQSRAIFKSSFVLIILNGLSYYLYRGRSNPAKEGERHQETNHRY